MTTTKQLLGSRIRELRRKAGMSQDQLSELIGIDSKHLSRIELGKSYPYVETLEGISKALGVDLMDLFDFSHLEPHAIGKNEICDMLDALSAEQLRAVYRIVKTFAK